MKDPDAFRCLDCDESFPCPDLPFSGSEPCCPYCESAEIEQLEDVLPVTETTL